MLCRVTVATSLVKAVTPNYCPPSLGKGSSFRIPFLFIFSFCHCSFQCHILNVREKESLSKKVLNPWCWYKTYCFKYAIEEILEALLWWRMHKQTQTSRNGAIPQLNWTVDREMYARNLHATMRGSYLWKWIVWNTQHLIISWEMWIEKKKKLITTIEDDLGAWHDPLPTTLWMKLVKGLITVRLCWLGYYSSSIFSSLASLMQLR